jgi:hypothetical protein
LIFRKKRKALAYCVGFVYLQDSVGESRQRICRVSQNRALRTYKVAGPEEGRCVSIIGLPLGNPREVKMRVDCARMRGQIGLWVIMGAVLALQGASFGDQATVTVAGTDAIFLAGRTDVTIAPPGAAPAGYPLVRNTNPPPGPNTESFPLSFPAAGSETFQFAASGIITFDYPTNGNVWGPDGYSVLTASINSLGGISGWRGPRGALVGLFLDDANPAGGTAPSYLSYSTNFTSLAPGLGQVFFIGDGLTGTGTGTQQTFTAPAGATRLFLGYPDAPYWTGAPGAYTDNMGTSQVTVTASGSLPEPATLGLLAAGGMALLLRRRR